MSDHHDRERPSPDAVRNVEPSATARLRREHRVILQVVDVLDAIVAGPDSGTWPLDDLDRCVEFFRLFTDACHHGQEEDVLFPTLEDRPGAGMHELIAIMRDEHRQGRALVADMRDALARLRSGSAAGPTLRAAADDYSALIRAHIQKEDGGLFDLADHVFDGPARQSLWAACDVVCRRRFGEYSLSDLEGVAHELGTRYLRP